MEVIKCKNGGIFSMCMAPSDIEWQFQVIWYKAQGCKAETVDKASFSGCECDHHKELDHGYEEFIEKLKEA